MEKIDYNDDSKEGKLRRWVANLQLESWQLELLITGFSIFLLASGVDEYESIKARMNFHKLVPTQDSTVIFAAAGKAILGTIPYVIQFFLISLLLHLLLRGFWIGIVGLSSVSSTIDYDKLNLKGPFKKYIPKRVRSLDDLIFYLDQVSSVIFAYTYLIVFSIISVVLVGCFLFSFIGLINFVTGTFGMSSASSLGVILIMIIFFLLFFGAIFFFLDSILFSAFKKSKWFSAIFFPIYRVFSILSLSFIYRSIYYHLITNFKRKHIISVTLVLVAVAFVTTRLNSWDRYTFFPEKGVQNSRVIETSFYDDERRDRFVYSASIPSKVVRDSFLPLFIRYSPSMNMTLAFFCPEAQDINDKANLREHIEAGVQSQLDTANSVVEIIRQSSISAESLASIIGCLESTFEVKVDGELIDQDFSFAYHPNEGEKGFLQMIDLEGFARGKHVISVSHLEYQGTPFLGEPTEERFRMVQLAEIVFWKE